MRQPVRSSLWLALAALVMCTPLWGCNSELKRARAAVSNKDYQQAAVFYDKVLTKDPENEDAMREVTKLHCVQKRNAFKCYGHAKKLYAMFPKDPTVQGWYKEALFGNALDAYIAMQLKQASKYIEQYQKIDPNSGRAFYVQADIMFRLNKKPPRNYDKLKEAVKLFEKAIKYSKEMEMIAVSSRKEKDILRWESHIQCGTIYEWLLGKARSEWARRRKKGLGPKKFEVNQVFFDKAKEHFEKASAYSEKHNNPYKRPFAFFKLGMLHAIWMKKYEDAIEYLKKGEKWGANDTNIVGNLKMIYDRLAEKSGPKQAKYRKLSQQYASKFDSLKGRK